MFTGIIEEVGRIEAISYGISSAQIKIKASKVLEDVKVGDSICVNGICLTVTSFQPGSFTADVMHETLNRTGLSTLENGSPVNLERAMLANGRFGGHIVSGHIDGTGSIASISPDDNAIWFEIKTSPKILYYIVEKGSITIDGISLTVAKVSEESFSISAIPHTVSETNLRDKKVGSLVNLECDVIGKYVEHFVKNEKPEEEGSKIRMDFLSQHGFISLKERRCVQELKKH